MISKKSKKMLLLLYVVIIFAYSIYRVYTIDCSGFGDAVLLVLNVFAFVLSELSHGR